MVSLEQVARRVLSYVPYVLVLVDLRYEGKKKSNTLRANFCWGARRKPSDTHRPHTPQHREQCYGFKLLPRQLQPSFFKVRVTSSLRAESRQGRVHRGLSSS